MARKHDVVSVGREFVSIFVHDLYLLSEYPHCSILQTFLTLLDFLFRLFWCLDCGILDVLSIFISTVCMRVPLSGWKRAIYTRQ